MSHYRWISFVCALCLAHAYSIAQAPPSDRAGDSLWSLWRNTSKPDSIRLTALNNFIKERFLNSDPDSALYYGNILYDMALKKDVKEQVGYALIFQGRAYMRKGDLPNAAQRLQAACDLFQRTGDQPGEANALNALAIAEWNQGDHPHSIDHFTRSLKISETLKDSSMIARTLGNIGVLYYSQKDTANAMDYYQRRLDIVEALGQKDILSEVVMNIGIIYSDRGEQDKAIASFARALALTREIDYPAMELLCLRNLAYAYNLKGDLATNLDLGHEALALAIRIDDRGGVADSHTALSDSYFDMGDMDKALYHGRLGMDLAEEVGNPTSLSKAAFALYRVDKKLGDSHEALTMHELYITMQDSILNDENKQAIMRHKFQYDYEKKEALLTAEQDKKNAIASEELRRKNLQRNAFIGGFGLMVLLAGVFFTQRNRISKERARSEELLLNILPEEVAEELKAKGAADAKLIDHVTVLFTDFKGFTAMSEKLTAKELVADIHECFSAFDRIMEKHGIEKIKTIGDAYMAAGGLPTPNTTHARDVVKAAFEIRDFIAEGKARKVAAGLPYFEIRIGIHTGPVVAGIVGVKKFSYDIWGDTVNTASRMESSGEVGQVNISEATYALVKDEPGLTFTPRGKVQAKGKGEMEMYFVSGS